MTMLCVRCFNDAPTDVAPVAPEDCDAAAVTHADSESEHPMWKWSHQYGHKLFMEIGKV